MSIDNNQLSVEGSNSNNSYAEYFDKKQSEYKPASSKNPKCNEFMKAHSEYKSEEEACTAINLICDNDSNKDQIYCKLNEQFKEIAYLMYALNVGQVNPRSQGNFLADMYRQQAKIDFLGRWVLPACYGMIGTMLLFMRRYLDSAIPDPSVWKLLYRIVLGGFAGVISVWFLTPAWSNVETPTFASTGAFGIAFLVGFSTDLLFGGLDRLTKAASDAVGK